MSGRFGRASMALSAFRDDPAKRKVTTAVIGILVCGYAIALGSVVVSQYLAIKDLDNTKKNDMYYGLGIAQIVIAIFAFVFIIFDAVYR